MLHLLAGGHCILVPVLMMPVGLRDQVLLIMVLYLRRLFAFLLHDGVLLRGLEQGFQVLVVMLTAFGG